MRGKVLLHDQVLYYSPASNFVSFALIFFQSDRVEETVKQKNRTDENLRKKEKESYELKNG